MLREVGTEEILLKGQWVESSLPPPHCGFSFYDNTIFWWKLFHMEKGRERLMFFGWKWILERQRGLRRHPYFVVASCG